MGTTAKKKKVRGKSKTSKLAEMFKTSINLTYKDLKRNAVVRGMPFEEVVNGSVPRLDNWLHLNNFKEIRPELLDEFDDWVEKQLTDAGKEDLIHPQLRLGYIGERGEDGEPVKRKRVKGIKKKKVKKEKTKGGLYKGTKKALTFQLQQEGFEMAEVEAKVIEEFPDANIKSVKIWYKKSRRQNA